MQCKVRVVFIGSVMSCVGNILILSVVKSLSFQESTVELCELDSNFFLFRG